MKRPPAPPPSAGVLARYARAYAQQLGVAEGRVRAWIAYMTLAGILEQAAASTSGRRFTVKGGVALELRLRDRARATKDIDLVLHEIGTGSGADIPDSQDVQQHTQAVLARAFEETLAGKTYQGFAFRRKGEPIWLDNGTVSMELGVTYYSGAWTSIVVDLAWAEPGEAGVEFVPAIPLRDAIGISGPSALPCLPLRLHIAQKLHGLTLPPRPGRRNERFKDLVDLLLLEGLLTGTGDTDYRNLCEACESVFRHRGSHAWPPPLEAPAHWEEPFARMARELDLPVHDAHTAMARVRALVERIASANPVGGTTVESVP